MDKVKATIAQVGDIDFDGWGFSGEDELLQDLRDEASNAIVAAAVKSVADKLSERAESIIRDRMAIIISESMNDCIWPFLHVGKDGALMITFDHPIGNEHSKWQFQFSLTDAVEYDISAHLEGESDFVEQTAIRDELLRMAKLYDDSLPPGQRLFALTGALKR